MMGPNYSEERKMMHKHTIAVTSVLALALSGTTLAQAATPAHAATTKQVVAHGAQRPEVALKLRSGARLTVSLPQGAVVTGLGVGASMVTAGSRAAGNGGGGVSPLARYINITAPGNNSNVAVNQYQTFTYQWSGGGCCDETFHSRFMNLTTNQGPYEFDTYHCTTFCDSGGHSFSKLFATKGIRWSYTVYDQNNNASTTIQFTTY